jgi:hypothetical protein
MYRFLHMSLEDAAAKAVIAADALAKKKRWGKRRSNGALKNKGSGGEASEGGAGAGDEGGESEGAGEGPPAAKKVKVAGDGLSGKGKVMGKKRS